MRTDGPSRAPSDRPFHIWESDPGPSRRNALRRNLLRSRNPGNWAPLLGAPIATGMGHGVCEMPSNPPDQEVDMTRRLGSSVSVLTAAALVITPMLAATLSGCSKSGRSNRSGAASRSGEHRR